jgi:hypothetical protein
MTDLAEIRLEVPGPFAIHNMPCAVCAVQPAVYFLDNGTFEPCWTCQEKGWQLRQKRRWLR